MEVGGSEEGMEGEKEGSRTKAPVLLSLPPSLLSGESSQGGKVFSIDSVWTYRECVCAWMTPPLVGSVSHGLNPLVSSSLPPLAALSLRAGTTLPD